MKKIPCNFIIYFLFLLLAAGCSSPKNTPTELEWFCDITFWKGVNWSLEPDTITGQISQKTGISCNLTIPAQNPNHELNLMILQDKLPDIISLNDTNMRKQLVDSGKVWDLEEFLTLYDPDSHLLHDFPQDVKKMLLQTEGGWYSFPSHISSQDMRLQYPPCDKYFVESMYHNNNNGIMFNRKWIKRFGLSDEDLQTEDALLVSLNKIAAWKKKNHAPLVPVLLAGNRYNDAALDALANSFGSLPLDKNGHYQNRILSTEYKHALAFCNKLYQDGIINTRQLVYENEDVRKAISDDNVFCFIGDIPNCGYQPKEWVSFGPILSSEGTSPVTPILAKLSGGWINTYISKTCREPEKLASFISFMTSDEGMMLSYYGKRDTQYSLDENGRCRLTETGISDVENYEETGLQAFWPFCNISWIDSKASPPAIDSADYSGMMITTALAKYPSTHIYEGALLENLYTENIITEEFSSCIEQINSWKEQQTTLLIMAKNPDEFETLYNETLSKLEEFGMKELDAKLDELYRQRCLLYNATIKDNLKESEEYLQYIH